MHNNCDLCWLVTLLQLMCRWATAEHLDHVFERLAARMTTNIRQQSKKCILGFLGKDMNEVILTVSI